MLTHFVNCDREDDQTANHANHAANHANHASAIIRWGAHLSKYIVVMHWALFELYLCTYIQLHFTWKTLSTLGCPSKQANHAKQLHITQFQGRHDSIECLWEDLCILQLIHFSMLLADCSSSFVSPQEQNFCKKELPPLRSCRSAISSLQDKALTVD